jgi:hypothetical protein
MMIHTGWTPLGCSRRNGVLRTHPFAPDAQQ